MFRLVFCYYFMSVFSIFLSLFLGFRRTVAVSIGVHRLFGRSGVAVRMSRFGHQLVILASSGRHHSDDFWPIPGISVVVRLALWSRSSRSVVICLCPVLSVGSVSLCRSSALSTGSVSISDRLRYFPSSLSCCSSIIRRLFVSIRPVHVRSVIVLPFDRFGLSPFYPCLRLPSIVLAVRRFSPIRPVVRQSVRLLSGCFSRSGHYSTTLASSVTVRLLRALSDRLLSGRRHCVSAVPVHLCTAFSSHLSSQLSISISPSCSSLLACPVVAFAVWPVWLLSGPFGHFCLSDRLHLCRRVSASITILLHRCPVFR